MDSCIREMKVGAQDLGVRLNVSGVEQPVVACLYADDIVLLAESEGMLQGIVDEFDRVCKRRKLKQGDFAKPNRVGSEVCKLCLGKEMEEDM